MASAVKHAAQRTLFHSDGARSLRVLWTLKELGLDYRLVTMPFPPRARAKDFKNVNPIGTIPFFVEKGAPWNQGMTESSAIPLYLAEKYDSEARSISVPKDHPEYGAFVNWLFYSEATILFPQTLVLRYTVFEKKRGLEQVGEDYRKWYLARLRLLEDTLSDGRSFLVGDKFTIADICVTYALWLSGQRGLDMVHDFPPVIHEYLERHTSRPSFRECLEEEQKSLAAFTPDIFASL
ncbi:Glutathione S-transferase 1 (GST-I) [Durusdinium trenchii]|uniref:Glutathione S-transferase 1 (GST-I) n=1 Tax=Durusdinium trenchii TaxID=1381693 RepID=A0ABP0L2Q4_9DINO